MAMFAGSITLLVTECISNNLAIYQNISLLSVGGPADKQPDMGLTWWDTIQILTSYNLNENSLPIAWDVTKGRSNFARMAVVTYGNIWVFRAVMKKNKTSGEAGWALEEECHFREKSPDIIVSDITICANMVIYSFTGKSRSVCGLTLASISSNQLIHLGTIELMNCMPLQHISLTPSAFLGIYENSDIVMCGVEQLVEEFLQGGTYATSFLYGPICRSNNSVCAIDTLISLSKSGSFAFLSDGNGDTVRLYYPLAVFKVENTAVKEFIDDNQEELL